MNKQNDVILFKKLLKEENHIINNYKSVLGRVSEGNTRKEISAFIEDHIKQAECINNILLSKGIKIKPSPIEDAISFDKWRNKKLTYDQKSREAIANLYREEIKGAINSKKYYEEISIELKPEMENLLNGRKKIIDSIEKIIEEN